MTLNDEYRETKEALPRRRALSESAPVPDHILSEIYANANIQVPRVNVNTDLSEAQVKAIVKRFSVFDVWDTSEGALSLPKASTCIMYIETNPEVPTFRITCVQAEPSESEVYIRASGGWSKSWHILTMPKVHMLLPSTSSAEAWRSRRSVARGTGFQRAQ